MESYCSHKLEDRLKKDTDSILLIICIILFLILIDSECKYIDGGTF